MPIHSARVRPFGAERPLMFAYYGTRGALPKLTLDLAREASGRRNNACTFSLATSNELYDEFSFMQDNLFAVNTFASPQQWQSIACIQRVKSLCADLSERVANDKTRAIVSLMPHVWSPFLLPCIRRAGINLVSIIHDADPHPGDRRDCRRHPRFLRGPCWMGDVRRLLRLRRLRARSAARSGRSLG